MTREEDIMAEHRPRFQPIERVNGQLTPQETSKKFRKPNRGEMIAGLATLALAVPATLGVKELVTSGKSPRPAPVVARHQNRPKQPDLMDQRLNALEKYTNKDHILPFIKAVVKFPEGTRVYDAPSDDPDFPKAGLHSVIEKKPFINANPLLVIGDYNDYRSPGGDHLASDWLLVNTPDRGAGYVKVGDTDFGSVDELPQRLSIGIGKKQRTLRDAGELGDYIKYGLMHESGGGHLPPLTANLEFYAPFIGGLLESKHDVVEQAKHMKLLTLSRLIPIAHIAHHR
jgi:hypothetical protein